MILNYHCRWNWYRLQTWYFRHECIAFRLELHTLANKLRLQVFPLFETRLHYPPHPPPKKKIITLNNNQILVVHIPLPTLAGFEPPSPNHSELVRPQAIGCLEMRKFLWLDQIFWKVTKQTILVLFFFIMHGRWYVKIKWPISMRGSV